MHASNAFGAAAPIDIEAAPVDEPTIVVRVERVPASAMIGLQLAWQDLCDRALERNVFFEPAFALPLTQHVVVARPDFLLAWEENGPTSFGRLIGLMPILAPTLPLPGILRGFFDAQIRLGTPLVDRHHGAAALDAMLDWLSAEPKGADALRLCALDMDNPFAALLADRCAASRRGLRRFGEHRRAVLRRGPDGVRIMPLCQTKRRKEIGRQRRRLSERGVRTYASATTQEDIARATERFLALEHNGWKGERGTALLATPTLATFTRSMTRLMGYEGKCRIDSIEIDGRPVAMGIILTIGDHAHFWKTTFHEAFAPLSPGVQFTLELTERQLANDGVASTDSCAVPDHPMIDRLWADRLSIADMLVELHPEDPGRFERACRLEALARLLRTGAKRTYLRLRHVLGTR